MVLLVDLHEILLHRFHHQYFQTIAIHDPVMINHQVERKMFSDDSVLMELFVVVEMVDVNEYEVEWVVQILLEGMAMMDDNMIVAFENEDGECFERQLNQQ